MDKTSYKSLFSNFKNKFLTLTKTKKCTSLNTMLQ